MGNNHSNGLSRTRSIVGRSKETKRTSKSSHEAFFIAHHKAQQAAALENKISSGDLTPISPITPTLNNQIDLRKRVIFVSLMGLYQSWKNVPSTILFSSIFLLPLKKQWIYNSEKYHYQHDFEHVLNDTNFVKLLKWKDAQGLVFWMKDVIPTNELQKYVATPSTPDFVDNDDEYNVNDVAPFWKYLSYKLSLLYDPMTGNNYNPLKLDYKWWKTRASIDASIDVSIDGIKKELYFLTMKFKTMTQLLYQSNQTLNIVTIYTLNVDGCSIPSPTKETSQKSYTSLPDHVLSEMAGDHYNDNITIDVNTSCSIDELNLNLNLNLNGEITPNPNNQQNDDYDEENNDNIWWVSTEYDQVMEIHDDDQLYEEYEYDNNNPLLTPKVKERDSILNITDRVTI